MFDKKYRCNLAPLLISLLLTACASNPPFKVGLTETENGYSRGVLWPYTSYSSSRSRLNYAYVTIVDGNKLPWTRPPIIELSVGKHEVTIEHRKEFWFCYMVCGTTRQTIVSVVLNVESGHSYTPIALRSCGKNWVWVIDKGEYAEDDLRRSTHGKISVRDYIYRPKYLNGFKVVAGEAPPDKCNAQ